MRQEVRMPTSGIPLFGLPDKVTVSSEAEAHDAMGGVVAGAKTAVYTNRKCRISKPDAAELATLPQGLDRKKLWKVLMKYSPNVTEVMVVTVPAGTKAPAGDYSIVFCEQQRDHNGHWHHTSLLVEAE